MSADAVPAGGLRVALLSPTFWPEVRRGGERIVRELADGLLARGHSPELITSHPGRPTRSVEDGLPVVRHWRPPDGRLQRRRFEAYLTHLPFSYLSLRRGDYDLAHAVYPTDALAAARWSRLSGRPAVLTYLGVPDRPFLASRRLRLLVTREAVAGCSAVVAISRTAAAGFSRWLGTEARVIYPGVDLDVFAPRTQRAEAPTIFCAATLEDPGKRVGLLISAFGLVRRERSDARLVLMPPRDPGAAERQSLEVPGLTWLLAEPSELPRAYGEAWVSVLPGRGESFGLTLVEALACGRPVVGSNHGAIPEVVDRESIGRLFDGDDEASLARALLEALELADDPSTAEACRRRAEDFSSVRMVDAYERLYRELI